MRSYVVVNVGVDYPSEEAGPHSRHSIVVLLKLKKVRREEGRSSEVPPDGGFVLKNMKEVYKARAYNKACKHT